MTNITIGNRQYISTQPFNTTFTFAAVQNYCFDLSDKGCLQLEGMRAADFLQGQLTCDIREVSTTQMRTGGLCNLKGRLLALMDVIHDNHCWYLLLPADLLELTQTSLAPFAMVSRCQLKKTDFKVYGLFIQNPETLPEYLHVPSQTQGVASFDGFIIYRINVQFAIIIHLNRQDDAIDTLLHHFIAQNTLKESLAWHYLHLKHQYFELYPTTRGLFLPHRLGLHQTNVISFEKGCYKGQEIIARMHYKSTMKHQLCFFEYETTESMNPGETLRHPKTQEEIGELIDFTPTEQPGKFWVAATCLQNTQ